VLRPRGHAVDEASEGKLRRGRGGLGKGVERREEAKKRDQSERTRRLLIPLPLSGRIYSKRQTGRGYQIDTKTSNFPSICRSPREPLLQRRAGSLSLGGSRLTAT